MKTIFIAKVKKKKIYNSLKISIIKETKRFSSNTFFLFP